MIKNLLLLFTDWYTNVIIDMWHDGVLDGGLHSQLKMNKKEYENFVVRRVLPKWYILRIFFIPSNKYEVTK